jgi:hypothetical protein
VNITKKEERNKGKGEDIAEMEWKGGREKEIKGEINKE